MSGTTMRSELHRLADELDDELVGSALRYLHQLAEHGGSADSADHSEAGTASYPDEPLWGIAGIGRSNGPSDIAMHKDDYLAEAYDTESRQG